jgi:hypothetical protein
MTKLTTKLQLGLNKLQNSVGDEINNLQESSLERQIKKLLDTNFKTKRQDKCIDLIQKIIDLSIKTELHKETSGIMYDARKEEIKNVTGAKTTVKAFTQAKDLNEKYLEWKLGDAEKIYDALKLATKDSGGKITDRVIENLASDSLVKNFFKMISAYIQYAIGLASQNDLNTANNKRDAGPFMKRIDKSKAAKDMKAKSNL